MAHLNKQSNTDQLPRRANNKRAATSQYRFENDTDDDEDVDEESVFCLYVDTKEYAIIADNQIYVDEFDKKKGIVKHLNQDCNVKILKRGSLADVNQYAKLFNFKGNTISSNEEQRVSRLQPSSLRGLI
jgi:hypothetical protein